MAKSPVSEALASSPATCRIVLTAAHKVACGPYLHGVPYEVPAEQAAHLVAHRGFVYADEGAQASAAPMVEEVR